MFSSALFKKTTRSNKVLASGPPPEDQILAMAEDRYWFVLNSHMLQKCHGNPQLTHRANAFKHALQTYGPSSDLLPDLRINKGKANQSVFHGHVTGDTGETYVIEWTVLDEKNRMMSLVGFDSHENYNYKKEPLSEKEKQIILNDERNGKIIVNATLKIEEVKEKVTRTQSNYRNQV